MSGNWNQPGSGQMSYAALAAGKSARGRPRPVSNPTTGARSATGGTLQPPPPPLAGPSQANVQMPMENLRLTNQQQQDGLKKPSSTTTTLQAPQPGPGVVTKNPWGHRVLQQSAAPSPLTPGTSAVTIPQQATPAPTNFWANRAKQLQENAKSGSSPPNDKEQVQAQTLPNSGIEPAPKLETIHQSEVVVTDITPKLSVIGTKDVDTKKLRPQRPKPDPNRSKSGSPIQVLANHFPVTFRNLPQMVFHYDVTITPKEGKKDGEQPRRDPVAVVDPFETTVPDRLLPVIWHKFEEEFHERLGARMPFDGKKNCYAARRLNLGLSNVWSDDLTMTDPDDDDKIRTFRIQLKLANEVKTEPMFTYLASCSTWERCELPQEVIQALDVALRYCPTLHFTPCNRSFYSDKSTYNISNLLELWFGHNQSLLLGRDNKATLNIDMANKAFIKRMPVKQLVTVILGKRESEMSINRWTEKQFREAENFLKGKLIQYGTGQIVGGKYEKSHRFVANKIVDHSAKSYQFSINGNMISIVDFFRTQKQMTLEHPEWPVVHIGNKNMTNYVPLELCEVVPQAYKGKLEAEDTSAMIKGAATEPKERFERILKSRKQCSFETCPILKEFGIQVEHEMVKIPTGKLLAAPSMACKNRAGQPMQDAPKGMDGKFQVDQYWKPANIPKVAFLNATGSKRVEDAMKALKKEIGQDAASRGMTTTIGTTCRGGNAVVSLFTSAECKMIYAKPVKGSATFNELVAAALAELKSKGIQLVIVVISKDGREYAAIKSEAEVKVGILTQCVKQDTVGKIVDGKGRQVLTNIMLKINAKLNGISFQLGRDVMKTFKFDTEPILILGADVTHPAPHSKSPSVAAITASHDTSGMCYQMHIQIQKEAAMEVIENISGVVQSMIEQFRQKTMTFPSRIIMFRDGVSEGQFPIIKSKEYNEGILEACARLNFKPKVTFVVVKKRHHTRFMPTNSRQAVKPKDNIPPGTVVDSIITHPTEMEYFLNSHVGIQGTSKPTRYHVIHDDSKFSMEDLELLTYYLCYTFVRCTHPVSYPAPTYYAHLAAFRARALLEKEGENADLSNLKDRLTIRTELAQNYPMFFV